MEGFASPSLPSFWLALGQGELMGIKQYCRLVLTQVTV